MANPEHVEILKQGVEAWNHWRSEHPDVIPELANVDFTRADDWKGTSIEGNIPRRRPYAHLMEINLSRA